MKRIKKLFYWLYDVIQGVGEEYFETDAIIRREKFTSVSKIDYKNSSLIDDNLNSPHFFLNSLLHFSVSSRLKIKRI